MPDAAHGVSMLAMGLFTSCRCRRCKGVWMYVLEVVAGLGVVDDGDAGCDVQKDD
jgi:hypothetical protein